jgi:hypothetical protein
MFYRKKVCYCYCYDRYYVSSIVTNTVIYCPVMETEDSTQRIAKPVTKV